jgi:hypothetical protein
LFCCEEKNRCSQCRIDAVTVDAATLNIFHVKCSMTTRQNLLRCSSHEGRRPAQVFVVME